MGPDVWDKNSLSEDVIYENSRSRYLKNRIKYDKKLIMEKPKYGEPGIHIFINLVFAVILLSIAVLGAIFLHSLWLLFVLPTLYFVSGTLE